MLFGGKSIRRNCANQPKPGRLEEDTEAAEPETPPQSLEPLPPQQSLAAQPLALSPLQQFDGDKQEEVVVAEIMEKGMALDEEKAKGGGGGKSYGF